MSFWDEKSLGNASAIYIYNSLGYIGDGKNGYHGLLSTINRDRTDIIARVIDI